MLDLFALPAADGVAVKRTPFVTVQLPGEPHGRTQPGVKIIRGKGLGGHAFPQFYKTAETLKYQNDLAKLARAQMIGKRMLEVEPVAVRCFAMRGVPASWPMRKRDAALQGSVFPVGTPDHDNYMKNADAFKGIVWRDDAQVCWSLTVKEYAEHPGIIFEVFLLP